MHNWSEWDEPDKRTLQLEIGSSWSRDGQLMPNHIHSQSGIKFVWTFYFVLCWNSSLCNYRKYNSVYMYQIFYQIITFMWSTSKGTWLKKNHIWDNYSCLWFISWFGDIKCKKKKKYQQTEILFVSKNVSYFLLFITF